MVADSSELCYVCVHELNARSSVSRGTLLETVPFPALLRCSDAFHVPPLGTLFVRLTTAYISGTCWLRRAW